MRPRKVTRIARWEITRNVTGVDRRVALAVVAGIVLVAALVPAVSGVALDRGIYRVGVETGHPVHDAVDADPTFAARAPSREAFDEGGLEILVIGDRVVYRDTEKGRAAIAALRRTIERYNDRRMREEANQSAAFPVEVSLRYLEREQVDDVVVADRNGAGDGSGGDGSGTNGGSSTGDGLDSNGGSRRGTSAGGALGGGAVGDLFNTGESSGAPSELSPPFPLQSLVLAFLFVVPLNFVIQAYGSSVLSERINRRGELLLVAPVTRSEIITGKTLPYLLVGLGIAAVVAFAVGGGPLSVLAVAPIALLFLGATFLAAMFARSFKELTFLTVAVSVFLTSYAFIPAVFTDVASVALISPLTLVVRDLSGMAVDLGSLAFATIPPTLAALVLFVLGAGIYREEDMFTQRPVHLKALDALAGRVTRSRSLVGVTAMLVPFVFVAELLALATLFVLPGDLSVILLLGSIAIVEEVAKSLPVVAGYEHDRFGPGARGTLVAGAASGVGFFLGEKLTLLVQLVGLPELRAGSAAFGSTAALSGGPLLVMAFLLAPLALHVVTTVISSFGAARGREPWLLGLVVAVALHVGYNLTVVRALG